MIRNKAAITTLGEGTHEDRKIADSFCSWAPRGPWFTFSKLFPCSRAPRYQIQRVHTNKCNTEVGSVENQLRMRILNVYVQYLPIGQRI